MQYWAYGVMGLTPAQYGSMTPGEFKAAKRGYLIKEIRMSHQFGQMVAFAFNDPQHMPDLNMMILALGDE